MNLLIQISETAAQGSMTWPEAFAVVGISACAAAMFIALIYFGFRN